MEWGEQYRQVLAELSGVQGLALSPGSLRRSHEATSVSLQMYQDVRRPDGVDDCYVWSLPTTSPAGCRSSWLRCSTWTPARCPKPSRV